VSSVSGAYARRKCQKNSKARQAAIKMLPTLALGRSYRPGNAPCHARGKEQANAAATKRITTPARGLKMTEQWASKRGGGFEEALKRLAATEASALLVCAVSPYTSITRIQEQNFTWQCDPQ